MDDKHYEDEYDTSREECPICEGSNTKKYGNERVEKYFDICIVEYDYTCEDCDANWVFEENYEVSNIFGKIKIKEGIE